jgi:hypothetical protein
MPTETIVFLAFVALFTAAIVIASVRQGRARAAHEEELSRGASARGWRFESLKQGVYRVLRFSGDTDGVEWTAESLRRTSGGGSSHSNRLRIGRWHGRWSPGVYAPIVFLGLPRGTEPPEFPKTPAEGDGFLAKMAQKAVGFAFDTALDDLFGKEAGADVDAGKLRPVDIDFPGFIMMAEDESEARRAWADGLERAMKELSGQLGSVLAQDKRPSVLIRSKGISLARTEEILTVNEVEQFLKSGVGLTRAFKFGRRS